ncbi:MULTISPECIES: MBL fold metallo-hydrolase [Halorussus]|uniref:MBL fold metallo-hydrolase n=1 Tax=Halorussus TaxID=1070314 RepID=UPI00209EBDCF|nr:MBL fold metallo-hydrolase [Halorussus vallis]USZ77861.1 MBL fold metallo-hydrolase [Halorussus vallis]
MKRIQLGNTVFEGQNDAYLLGVEPGATTTLVDTGVATPDVREQLRDGLAEHGVEFSDLDAIFLTHWHHDHAGLAGELQRESGATVYAHEADAPVIEDPSASHEAQADELGLFDDWGMPKDARDELTAFLELHEEIRGESPTVETVGDGDRFDLGDVELEVVHLPGHAAGLAGYAFDGESGRELFAGDALLPKYTPNVGGADPRVEDPLGTYLASLDRLVEAEYARAWPGHRDPIDDPAGRAREIRTHHRERTENVLAVLRERGIADAWTVSADLFGDLSEIHILHGPGEAWAHLDHLERHGVVENTDEGYELVEERPDLDSLFSDGTEARSEMNER